MDLDQPFGIKVAYHALFMCDFQISKEHLKEIMGKCVQFLCAFVKNWQTMDSLDERLSVAMVLRMVGNLIALPSQTDNSLKEFICLLAIQNETFPNIINAISKIDASYKNEILWVAGNIYQANETYRNEIVSSLILLK